jgi:hypothetical protein
MIVGFNMQAPKKRYAGFSNNFTRLITRNEVSVDEYLEIGRQEKGTTAIAQYPTLYR